MIARVRPLTLPEWRTRQGELPAVLVAALARVAPARAEDPAVVETLESLRALHADAETLALAVLGTAALDWREAPEGLRALAQGYQDSAKVWPLWSEPNRRASNESLLRLLLVLARDLRVVLVLLAEHLVKLRHASRAGEAERQGLARLTRDLLAPLANRLGIWQLKWELEDLAFRYLQPQDYKALAAQLDGRRTEREQYIEAFKGQLRRVLDEAGIRAELSGRPKHLYSIWKKMQRKGVDLAELYDVRAVRVLVDDVPSCYAALGVVHNTWTPIPKEFDDYIAHPKRNHYRSLHTAVIGPQGKAVEVQIRTHEMHAHAELGVAAHWRYKEGGAGDAEFEKKINELRLLLEGREDGAEEGGSYSTEALDDTVYLLTPKGQIIELPRGATVLDFAYSVHTEVGHRCRGALVNGRIVPLTHQPGTGDRVEVLTGKEPQPKRDWLLPANGYLHTHRARSKVKQWFNRLDHAQNVRAGRELMERELKRMALHDAPLAPILAKLGVADVDALYVAVALGEITPGQVVRALHERQRSEAPPAPVKPRKPSRPPKDPVTIEGVGNLLVQMAQCCKPVAGDAIAGYITRGRGVAVHRADCRGLAGQVARDPARLIPVQWSRGHAQQYAARIRVDAYDRPGLLKDLTTLLAGEKINILDLGTRVDRDQGTAHVDLTFEIGDFEQLSEVLGKLKRIAAVYDVRRLGG